jgi:hypothetical protein
MRATIERGRRAAAGLGLAALAAHFAAAGASAGGDGGLRAAAVVRVVAGGAEIPVIRTARGVTTMLSLPEEAREAVCGDLYDPETGAGGFVIRRSGRDLFLKPLRAGGVSNLFVKTERATYAFELVVVSPRRAMRIVYVESAAPAPPVPAAPSPAEPQSRDGPAEAASLVRSGEGMRCLEVSFDRGLIAAGRVLLLRCEVRNAGTEPVAVGAAEVVGALGRRTVVGRTLPPGGAATVVIRFDARPGLDAAIRFVDAAGEPLFLTYPFR